MPARSNPLALTYNTGNTDTITRIRVASRISNHRGPTMRRAALGIRVHSGWGALIAVSHENAAIEILDRRRVSITGTTDAGASQPYHGARNLHISEAEPFLASAFAAAHTAASSGLREVMDALHGQEYQVTGCTILMAS